MPAVTFDTLKFANQLKTAGVPVTHAEAEAKALSEIFETNLGELATKEDLHHEIDGLRHEVKELETGLRQEIGDLRHEMKELETGLRHEMGNLETGLRHEMGNLEIGLRHEISDLRKDIDTKLEKLELRMTIKLGSIVVVALGAFTVIFKFL